MRDSLTEKDSLVDVPSLPDPEMEPRKGRVRFFTSTSFTSLSLEQFSTHQPAVQAFISLVTGLYALVLVILSFAFEIAAVTVQGISIDRYELFFIYLYTMGIAFLLYCQCFLLKTDRGIGHSCSWETKRWLAKLCSSGEKEQLSSERAQELTAEYMSRKRKATYSAPTAGSLYLRLGAIVFGTMAIIDNFVDLYFMVKSTPFWCLHVQPMITLCLSAMFIFLQLYFVFENSKVVIHRFKALGKFGVMHIVATNLCIWIRAIVLEEAHVLDEISEEISQASDHLQQSTIAIQQLNHEIGTRSMDGSADASQELHTAKYRVSQLVTKAVTEVLNVTNTVGLGSHAGLKQFLTTCLIEYSLICAAIMFIIWLNIGTTVAIRLKHRKHNIRVDCSNSDIGLFAGLFVVVATVMSMIVFFVQIQENDSRGAVIVLYISDIVLYMSSIAACLFAAIKMRTLTFSAAATKSNAVLLDDILLFVALVGQLLYCIFGVVALVKMSPLVTLSVTVNVLRMTQVLMQTALIVSAQRLVATSEHKKPGRQIITFLLIVNIALWLVNTFEHQKANSNPVMLEFYGKGPWYVILHGTVPLTIFYRFHSSVCLAEIWKNCYKGDKVELV